MDKMGNEKMGFPTSELGIAQLQSGENLTIGFGQK